MVPKICSIPECGKPARGRGWCGTHWLRWRKHGDPTIVLPKGSTPKHVGCKVDGCSNKHHSQALCSTHYARFMRHGDPLTVGDHYPGRKRMDKPSYTGMHKRLFYDRGKASAHQCVDCGSPAQEWSYDGGCPNEILEVLVIEPIPYTTDQTKYSPRCIKCHRSKDESLNRGRDKAGRFAPGPAMS